MRKILLVITTIFVICHMQPIVSEAGAEEGKVFTLQDCISIALRQSPLIRSSEFDIKVSEESLNISKGALLPRLDLNGSFMKENQPFPYIPAQSMTIPAKFSDEIYSWGLYFRLPVYEGGRLLKQIDISKIEEEIQSARLRLTIEDVIVNVTNTFNKLLQLKELQKATEISVDALEHQRKNTELSEKAGRAAHVELLRTEVQLASEKQNLIRVEESIIRTKAALAFFMGITQDQLAEVIGTLKTDEKIPSAGVDELLKARPDIVAASKKVEQSRFRVDAAYGKRYPSVALAGNYGNRAGSGFHQREEVWEAGAVASVNLFDGGIISSEIRREKALLNKSEEELRLLQLKARFEVDNALSLLKEAVQRLQVAEKAVEQSEESFRIEELKYKSGAGTVTDALLSQSSMSLAQANNYQAMYDYNAAIVEFKKATGTIEVSK